MVAHSALIGRPRPRGDGSLTLPSPRGHASRYDLTVAVADAEVYQVSPEKVTVKVVATRMV